MKRFVEVYIFSDALWRGYFLLIILPIGLFLSFRGLMLDQLVLRSAGWIISYICGVFLYYFFRKIVGTVYKKKYEWREYEQKKLLVENRLKISFVEKMVIGISFGGLFVFIIVSANLVKGVSGFPVYMVIAFSLMILMGLVLTIWDTRKVLPLFDSYEETEGGMKEQKN